jgi:hypothetical protein
MKNLHLEMCRALQNSAKGGGQSFLKFNLCSDMTYLRSLYIYRMKPIYVTSLLILILLGDLGLSFLQYLSASIDGDLYAIVLPAPWYEQVLHDVLGLNAVLDGESYGGAGRFSAHFLTSTYFNYMPQLWQTVVSPVDSIYFSAATAKLAAHFGVIMVGASYILGRFQPFRRRFWIAAAAIVPFIQTYGLYHRMGLVDRSITYTFFYIIPIIILLAVLFPFYQYALGYRRQSKSFSLGVWTVPFLVIMVFLGSVEPQVQFLMVSISGLSLISIAWFYRKEAKRLTECVSKPFRGPYWQMGPLLLAMMFSGLWGYIAGQQNIENVSSLPLLQTVIQAAKGLVFHYIQVWPIWFIAAGIAYHLYRLRFRKEVEIIHFRRFLFISFTAICIYMVALPFGGYRSYRPYIYRYDLLIPVTLWLIYALLSSGRLYLKYLHPRHSSRWYIPMIIGFGVVLYAHDLSVKSDNRCEKSKLVQLSQAQTDTVVLDSECPILGWEPDQEYYFTDLKVQMLQRWGIVEGDLTYIQK